MIKSMTGVGDSADKPYVLGKDDGSDAVFVETTGLYEGIPKGQQVWVTGTKVDIGIHRGSLIPIGVEGTPMVTKVTRVPATEPPPIAESHPWSPDPPAESPPPPERPDPSPLPDDLDPEEPIRYNPADHTVDEVIDFIEKHPDEAGAVLAAERAGKNRKGIINEFEE